MAAIVSQVLSQLGSIVTEELKQRGRLVLGAEKDVKKLTSTFTAIEALLLDAEERQLKDKGVEVWLKKLKDMSYEIDDVLDEWRTEILKRQLEGDVDDEEVLDGDDHQHVPSAGCLELKLLQISDVVKRVCPFLPAYCFSPGEIGLRYDIASRIKDLNGSLNDIDKEKNMYNFTPKQGTLYQSLQTSPNVNFLDVKGREEETKILRRKLLDDEQSHPVDRSISIQGTGGLGKTTLAKVLYNDKAVEAHFDKRIWVCVSDNFDQSTVARAILESFDVSTVENGTLSYMLEQIRAHTTGKRFLLVFDDVWEDSRSKWEELRNAVSGGLDGSKILVTTRKEEVSRVFGCSDLNILRLDKMSDDACWAIFAQFAFCGWSEEEKERVEDFRVRVVKKSYGSPLAAKVLGGILQSKRTRREWTHLLGSEMWQMKEGREEVLAPLALSYYDLPPALRQCFQFCAVFPQDYEMEKDVLVKLWMSQGFLETTTNQDLVGIGEEYFEILAMRSFFQNFEERWDDGKIKTYCKMHDLVHDFARLVSKNECVSIMNRDISSSPVTPPYIMGNEVRHLMVEFTSGANNFLPSIGGSLLSSTKHNYLRSFMARNAYAVDQDVYNHLQGIRTLVLYECRLKEIPSTISQLIHLRHLDLSNNIKLWKLPEELCDLYNLETLLLNGNSRLRELPSRMGNKLVNLKHLENIQVPAILPRSIGRLTSLKTLIDFKIEEDEEGGTNIVDLEGMNLLQGLLLVSGLYNVTNCEEVKRAQFAKKECLTRLWLQFQSDYEDEDDEEEAVSDNREEQVLEAIWPPSTSLEELCVMSYNGRSIYPSWLMSLTNLTTLDFRTCSEVEHLPPLGALPSLENLSLSEMDKVKKVGVEFLFLGTIASGNSNVAFPKLKVLEFGQMRNWEEWELEMTGVTKTAAVSVIMPRLRSFSLRGCEKLEKLPEVLLCKTTLEELRIDSSGGFGGYRFNNELVPSEVWDTISHIPTIIFDWIDIRARFKSKIESMSEIGCSNSKQEAGDDETRAVK